MKNKSSLSACLSQFSSVQRIVTLITLAEAFPAPIRCIEVAKRLKRSRQITLHTLSALVDSGHVRKDGKLYKITKKGIAALEGRNPYP